MPIHLRERIDDYTREEDIRKAGLEHAITQSLDLIAQRAPGIHFFTMGACDPTIEIIDCIFSKTLESFRNNQKIHLEKT